MTQSLDVVKINLVGNPSTGKTTLAGSIAHLIHQLSMEMYKTPFAVKFFSRTELVNFEATLKTLEGMNQVLIFDDISFLQATTDRKTHGYSWYLDNDVIKEAKERLGMGSEGSETRTNSTKKNEQTELNEHNEVK